MFCYHLGCKLHMEPICGNRIKAPLLLLLALACQFSSCVHPRFHFVPATLLFEDQTIPRYISEAPLFKLGQDIHDSKWRELVTYTGSAYNGFTIPEISVLNYRTTQFFVSDSSAIVELRMSYEPFSVDPEAIISDFEDYLEQEPKREHTSVASKLRIGPLPPPKHTYVATWLDETTILQVKYSNAGDVVIRIVDKSWQDIQNQRPESLYHPR